jgi:hypothetical protein
LDGYKTLKEGDDVEFDIVQGQKGAQADAVIRLRGTTPSAAPSVTPSAALSETPSET